RARRSDVREFSPERTLRVEHLNPLVAHVGDVDIVLGIDRDGLHASELPRAGPGRAPVREKFAVLVELRDAIVVAKAVGDVDVAGAIPGYVGWLTETRAWSARACGAGAARGTRPRGSACCRIAAAAACWLRGTDGDVFRFASEHERDASLGIELHDLTGRGVDSPDVVLWIDAEANRGIEAIHILPELPYEPAGLIELEQARSAVHE